MKQILLAVAVLAGVFATDIVKAQSVNPTQGNDRPYEHREMRQHREGDRRMHGNRVAFMQAQRLHMKMAELHGMKKMARADGKVTRRERRLIRREERQLDHIADRARHDRWDRRDRGYSRNEGNRRDHSYDRPGQPQQETLPPGYFN